MDDTDTSHLQSPDATLPASSLANDLKILLTYSKRAERGWVALQGVQKGANLKESSGGWGGGVAITCEHILKIYLFISDGGCFQTEGTRFSLRSTRVQSIKVRDMCLILEHNCSPHLRR